MSRPVFHPQLQRLLLPSQYSLIRALEQLYPGGQLMVTDEHLLLPPPPPKETNAVQFRDVIDKIWQKTLHRPVGYDGIPSSSWISPLPTPPEGQGVRDMMLWVNEAIEEINREVSKLPVI